MVDPIKVAVELEAKNGAFNASVRTSEQTYRQAMSTMERSASQAEAAIARSSQTIAESTDHAAYRGRLLGYQFQDIGAQLAGGQSPFLILAQQGPQVVQALDGAGGAVGRVAAILSGPFGAAGLAAVSVLGQLAATALSAGDAQKKHAAAADELKEAEDRLAAATATANHATAEGIRLDIQASEALRQKTIRTRQQLQAELEAAKSRRQIALGQSDDAQGGGLSFGVAGAATQDREVDRLNKELAKNQQDIAKYAADIRGARANLVLRDVAAATDKAAAVTQRYENRIDMLRRQFEAGRISEGKFRDLTLAATRARDAANDSLKKSTSGHERHGRAVDTAALALKAAAAAQRELDSALGDIQRRFDPAAAAAADYAKQLREIAELEKAGRITGDQATGYRDAAAGDYVKNRAQAFNLPSVEGYRGEYDENDRNEKQAARDAERDALDAERAIAALREDRIRTAARLYEDLFTGGTHAVWDDFKRLAFQVLAEVLAKQTIGAATGGGGFFGAISSAVGSIFGKPGLASGGSIMIGGNAGVDQNVLSLNGNPIARVGQGEALVLPSGGAAGAARAGAVTVIQNFTLDNRYGITTPELLARVNQVMTARGNEARDQAVAIASRQAPGAVAKAQRYGG